MREGGRGRERVYTWQLLPGFQKNKKREREGESYSWVNLVFLKKKTERVTFKRGGSIQGR